MGVSESMYFGNELDADESENQIAAELFLVRLRFRFWHQLVKDKCLLEDLRNL